MSGCRNGGRVAFEDGVLRGSVTFTDGTVMPLSYSAYRGREVERFDMGGKAYIPAEDEELVLEGGEIVAVVLGGTRFERVRTCEMERTYVGEPCSDWKCSACGKIQTAHNGAKLGERCPRCGAKVVDVVAGVRA